MNTTECEHSTEGGGVKAANISIANNPQLSQNLYVLTDVLIQNLQPHSPPSIAADERDTTAICNFIMW